MGVCCSIQHQSQSQQHRHNRKPSGRKGHGTLHSLSSKAESMSKSSKGSMSMITTDVKELRLGSSYVNVNSFSYEEMRMATKQFSPGLIVGEGGFGIVYRGVLNETVREGSKSALKVAIKELNPEGFQGDREWLAEINYLGQLSHPNLVKLIGYCCEDEHRLLVYEYMESGSLEKNLFRRTGSTLTWSTRLKIALDAARGLAFLHDAERPIIYRDFKTSNILLDQDYNAKLSDFGLAKEGPMGDQTHVSTRVMGTYGYAAPEYVMTGHLTARSDVYGFGVVLLELLIGRRAMDKSRPSGEHNLVEWARPVLNHKKVIKIFDPRMDGQYTWKAALKIANLAYLCISQNPKSRPVMSQVVEILEQFQTPPRKEEVVGSVTLYEASKDPSEKNTIRNKTPAEGLLKSQSDVPQGNRGNAVDHGMKRGESEEELDASYFSQ